MKKVIITGAAGFIGSHLSNRLLAQGIHVVGLDNLRYGRWSNVSSTSIGQFQAIELDLAIATNEDYNELFKGSDTLFHLAAEKHNNSIDDPVRVYNVNIQGTHRLFEQAIKQGIKNIVFTSSLYAYGKVNSSSLSENEVPTPSTAYGIAKLAGEGILRMFAQQYGINYSILRLFFVYGPKQYIGTGYPSVIVKNFNRILSGNSPTIYGDGNQILDYIYVDDVVDALIKSAASNQSQSILNLSTGKGTSINELTQLMLETANSKLRPEFCQPDWTHGTIRVGENKKIKDNLKWEPKVTRAQGMRSVWDWIKNTNVNITL